MTFVLTEGILTGGQLVATLLSWVATGLRGETITVIINIHIDQYTIFISYTGLVIFPVLQIPHIHSLSRNKSDVIFWGMAAHRVDKGVVLYSIPTSNTTKAHSTPS